jgi:hypothetical protein
MPCSEPHVYLYSPRNFFPAKPVIYQYGRPEFTRQGGNSEWGGRQQPWLWGYGDNSRDKTYVGYLSGPYRRTIPAAKTKEEMGNGFWKSADGHFGKRNAYLKPAIGQRRREVVERTDILSFIVVDDKTDLGKFL